jgi:purine-cytosine permease-like protein
LLKKSWLHLCRFAFQNNGKQCANPSKSQFTCKGAPTIMAENQKDQSLSAVESEAQVVDPIFGVEIHGLDPIPAEQRHGAPRELFWTWLGGNFNYVALATGALTILFGLSIWQAIAAAIVGSILGAIVFGFCGIFGPCTATATIVNTRAAFGLNGNYPAALISWLSASGWVAVNSVLAIFALIQLAGARLRSSILSDRANSA